MVCQQRRVCVDLKPLNANVLREVHPLPAVDETLTGPVIFSKLGIVASGRSLCQLPPDPSPHS